MQYMHFAESWPGRIWAHDNGFWVVQMFWLLSVRYTQMLMSPGGVSGSCEQVLVFHINFMKRIKFQEPATILEVIIYIKWIVSGDCSITFCFMLCFFYLFLLSKHQLCVCWYVCGKYCVSRWLHRVLNVLRLICDTNGHLQRSVCNS